MRDQSFEVAVSLPMTKGKQLSSVIKNFIQRKQLREGVIECWGRGRGKDNCMQGLIRRRIDTDALWSRDAAQVCVALRRGILEVAFEHSRLVGTVRILLCLGITWHGHHICWEVPANTEAIGKNRIKTKPDVLFTLCK